MGIINSDRADAVSFLENRTVRDSNAVHLKKKYIVPPLWMLADFAPVALDLRLSEDGFVVWELPALSRAFPVPDQLTLGDIARFDGRGALKGTLSGGARKMGYTLNSLVQGRPSHVVPSAR